MNDVSNGLKDCLRKFPAAVNVISTRLADGRYFGITATAVTVGTLLPPTMIVCVNRDSAFAQAIGEVDHFCINVLAQDQTDVAAANAGGLPQAERETVGIWVDGPERVPVLTGAQSNIVCCKANVIPVGTHLLLLGEALDAQSPASVAPLIYLDRKYGTFAAA